jgi:dolichyl-phosphate-mannose--protein O-mannosyl transferase
MSDSHSESYFVKLLFGFGAIIGSTLLTYFAIFEDLAKPGDWYFYAIVAAFLLCGGIYFCLQAFVHKVKSDFSKRSKQREMQKTKTE